MKAKKPIPILLASFMLFWTACGPENKKRADPTMTRVPAETNTIAYREIGQTGLIVIEAKVNGSDPLRFLLDTGASDTFLFSTPRSEKINLAVKDLPRRQPGHRSAPIPWKDFADVRIQIGDVRLDHLTVHATHWSHLPIFTSEDRIWCDGVIGFDLLRHVAAEIDRKSRTIRFHPPGSFAIPENWKAIPLEFTEKKPYCFARVRILGHDDWRDVKLHLDLGMAGFLALNPSEASGIRTPPGSTAGEAWLGGRVVLGSSASIRELEFLNRRFEDVLTSFPTSGHPTKGERNGSIGSLLLKRFDLVIDFPGRQLAGKPIDGAE